MFFKQTWNDSKFWNILKWFKNLEHSEMFTNIFWELFDQQFFGPIELVLKHFSIFLIS